MLNLLNYERNQNKCEFNDNESMIEYELCGKNTVSCYLYVDISMNKKHNFYHIFNPSRDNRLSISNTYDSNG